MIRRRDGRERQVRAVEQEGRLLAALGIERAIPGLGSWLSREEAVASDELGELVPRVDPLRRSA